MNNERTMSPEEHAWRAYCAIQCACARLGAPLEAVGHLTDKEIDFATANSAAECARLVGETVGHTEASAVLGKAEACLLGIRALHLIAVAPQVTGEPHGWGYDTAELDTAANWLYGFLRDLVHEVEPWQWLDTDDRRRATLEARRGA